MATENAKPQAGVASTDPERWLPMQGDDPFAVLGLPRGASQAEIKRAYRSLSARFHPDAQVGAGAAAQGMVGSLEEATKAFLAIQQAFQQLRDARQSGLPGDPRERSGGSSQDDEELGGRTLLARHGLGFGGRDAERDLLSCGQALLSLLWRGLPICVRASSGSWVTATWVVSAILGGSILIGLHSWHAPRILSPGPERMLEPASPSNPDPLPPGIHSSLALRRAESMDGAAFANARAHHTRVRSGAEPDNQAPEVKTPEVKDSLYEAPSHEAPSHEASWSDSLLFRDVEVESDAPIQSHHEPQSEPGVGALPVLSGSPETRNNQEPMATRPGARMDTGNWAGIWDAVCLAAGQGEIYLGWFVLGDSARLCWRTVQSRPGVASTAAACDERRATGFAWSQHPSIRGAILLHRDGGGTGEMVGTVRSEHKGTLQLRLELPSFMAQPPCREWELYRPDRAFRVEGLWFLAHDGGPSKGAFAPEHLQMWIERRGGLLTGTFQGRYSVPLSSMASSVRFQFQSPESASLESIPWSDHEESQGEVSLFPLGTSRLVVQWSRLSTGQGRPQLSSGVSILRRMQ